MGVPGLWGSHIVMQGEQEWVQRESSLKMESKSDIHRVMLRHYSLALVSPLPVPWNWHCASRQCHQAIVRPPQGHGAGAETQQHRERSPKGLVWKKPCCPATQETESGDRNTSAIGSYTLACPQLSEAGAGLAAEWGMLTATLGDAKMCLHLSAGWETAFILCSAF